MPVQQQPLSAEGGGGQTIGKVADREPSNTRNGGRGDGGKGESTIIEKEPLTIDNCKDMTKYSKFKT